MPERGRKATATLLAGGGGLLLGALAVLFAGAVTKLPCMGTLDNGLLPRHYCYADIANLFRPRQLGAHVFPYVHGRMSVSGTGNAFMGHGEIEYPVLTGLFIWLSALPVGTAGAFQVSSSLMLAPFGILAAWCLWRLAGRRAWYFVLTPALATYAFLNWDLIGVALALTGIYLWSREHPNWAAVAFAVGTCAKVWPGLLLLPLVTQYALLDRRRAWTIAGLAGATALLLNAPFIIVNPRGWYIPFAFQSLRPVSIDTNSLWYWDAHMLSTRAVNLASTVAVAIGLVVAITWSVQHYRRTGTYPFLQVGALSVAWYLLTWKVYSPQYDLWLLPFFALGTYRRALWADFVLADTALYTWWLLGPPASLHWLLAVLVFWRAVTVAWFMRSSIVGATVHASDNAHAVLFAP